jgi:parallel beta-helix repeat protein
MFNFFVCCRRCAVGMTIVLGMAAACTEAETAEIYVSPYGSDNGAGTEESPYRTVRRGLADCQPGDVLYMRGGTYHEGEISPEVNGTPDNPITIRNFSGEEVVVDGEYTRWQFLAFHGNDGFVVDGLTMHSHKSCGVSVRYSGYVTVRNCTSFGNGSSGIEMNYGEYAGAEYNCNMTVENNICYENGWLHGWASGIHLNNKNMGGANSHHIIRNNICYNNFDGSDHDTDGNGIMYDMGDGGTVLIENNLCFNNGDGGIRVMDGRAVIINNTCFRNGWDQTIDYQSNEIEIIAVYDPGSTDGSVVRNNIMWARPKRDFNGQKWGGVFRARSVNSFVFDHNVIWSDAPEEIEMEEHMVYTLKVEPLLTALSFDDELEIRHGATFLNMQRDDYDFRLMEASPAIDAGALDLAPAVDLAHHPRTAAPDAGALEYLAPPLLTAAAGSEQSWTLSAQFGGGTGCTYVWRRDGQIVAETAGPELVVPLASPAEAGVYSLTVYDRTGSAYTSEPVYLAMEEGLPVDGKAIGAALLGICAIAIRGFWTRSKT